MSSARHELSKWRHQVATLEGQRPKEEAQVGIFNDFQLITKASFS